MSSSLPSEPRKRLMRLHAMGLHNPPLLFWMVYLSAYLSDSKPIDSGAGDSARTATLSLCAQRSSGDSTVHNCNKHGHESWRPPHLASHLQVQTHLGWGIFDYICSPMHLLLHEFSVRPRTRCDCAVDKQDSIESLVGSARPPMKRALRVQPTFEHLSPSDFQNF